MTRRRSTGSQAGWPAKLALGAVSLALALLSAEAVLRLVAPGYSPLFLDIYRLEDGLLTLRPNLRRRHFTSEWEVSIQTNGEGLRDEDQPADDAGGRVLALGDSFAFGWGVELEESFLARAERALEPRRVRVIKAGMPGTGPVDQRLWLERRGGAYDPDWVLMVLFVGNDFVDAARGGASDQFTVDRGLLVRRAAEGEEDQGGARRWLDRLKRSSLLAQRMARVLWIAERRFLVGSQRTHLGLRARDPWLAEFVRIHLREEVAGTEREVERTLDALDGIRAWCAKRGAGSLLLVLPRSFQVYGWELARWREAFDLAPDDLDLDRPQRILAEWANENDVAFLDLLPAFRSYAARTGAERLYFYPDAHLNRTGHQLVGELLASWFRERLPNGEPPGPAVRSDEPGSPSSRPADSSEGDEQQHLATDGGKP